MSVALVIVNVSVPAVAVAIVYPVTAIVTSSSSAISFLWINGPLSKVNVSSVKSVGDTTWVLLEDFEWHGIIVPCGFTTDFASIPRPFWSFINPAGRIKPAALVHDFLYSKQGILTDRTLTRIECDNEFLKIMKVIGMGWFKRQAAYQSVKWFGWIAWNKKRSLN